MMYGQGMYGAPPLYGMYGYDPRAAAEAARGRPPERETTPVKFTEGKLFIGGVEAPLITKDDLVQYCSQWGEVADAVVMDRKGYGFVTFADPKNAMKFLETREHELKGRRLDAKAAVPKAQLGTAKLTKKMFVGGTGELTDEDFREHFSQYGDIEDAAVVRREGMSRGFGFVTFADEISVEKCLLVNHFIKGRKVELKRAVPKEDLGAAAAAAAGGMQAVGAAPMAGPLGAAYPPQQLYPYPYPSGPYAVRPGVYPGPGAAPMQAMPGPVGDPYAAWYGMGYMPYYPAGMYPPPYGVVPQPYAGVPYAAAPSMTPGPAAAPAQGRLPPGVTVMQEEAPYMQAPRTGAAAAAPRGPGRPPSGSPGAAGPSSSAAAGRMSPAAESIEQQRSAPASSTPSSQHRPYEVAASPAGAAATPERAGGTEGPSPRPGSSSSAGQHQLQPLQISAPSGLHAPGLGAGSPATAGRRPMLLAAYPPTMVPGVMVRPQPLPMPPRGLMGVPAGPQAGLTTQGQLPGRLQLPGTFAGQQQPQPRGPSAGGSSGAGQPGSQEQS